MDKKEGLCPFTMRTALRRNLIFLSFTGNAAISFPYFSFHSYSFSGPAVSF